MIQTSNNTIGKETVGLYAVEEVLWMRTKHNNSGQV